MEQHSNLLAWAGGVSFVAFIATLIAIPWLVAKIPEDYFLTTRTPKALRQSGTRRWALVGLRNLVGLVLFVAGLLMLILPGQGILTMVLGLSLLDFPGKRPFIRWLVSKPMVYRSLDWLRRKRNAPPLDLPRR